MPGVPFAQPFRRSRRPIAPRSTILAVPSAPATPNTPSPADTATASYTLLTWLAARATKFDVYLQTSPLAFGYAQGVLADLPVAYWRLDEASGDFVDEIAGLPAVVGAHVFPSQSGALADGNDAVLFSAGTAAVADSPTFHFTGTASIEVWFRISTGAAATIQTMISIVGPSAGITIKFRGGQLRGIFNVGGVNVSADYSGAVPALDIYHHLVSTYDGANVTLYLDGAVIAQTPASGALDMGTAGLEAGASSFLGSLDEWAVYNYALTPAQVAMHYARQNVVPPNPASLHQVGTSYVPTVVAGTTYYWQVVAINDGGSAAGPIWSFTMPSATAILVSIAGALHTRVRFDGASIHDVLNAAPNTGRLAFDTSAPAAGSDIQIGLGTLDADHLLFGGEIQFTDPSYVDTDQSLLWPTSLIDYTFTINKRRPFGTWVNVSATIVGQSIVARFAPGYTATHVQADLPLVSINFDGQADFMSCLGQLAQAIGEGGYCDVDYSQDVHLALIDTRSQPDPVDSTHPPLNDPQPLAFSTDVSQVRTRMYGKGHGEQVPFDVPAGETIVPIADAVMFNVNGGLAIGATIAGGAQTEIFDYAGIQLGGNASVAGIGFNPPVAPSAEHAVGVGLDLGWHAYAEVWVTAAGRTLPSPLAVLNARPALATPPNAPGVSLSDGEGTANLGAIGDTVAFAYSYSAATAPSDLTQESALSAACPAQTLVTNAPGTGYSKAPQLLVRYAPDPDVRWIHLWVSRNGGAFQRSLLSTPNLPVVGAVSISGGYPVTADAVPSTGALQQATISKIAVGPTGTTARELYRTAAQPTKDAALAAQLKLLTTIADNTSTGPYVDAIADAGLGSNAPTSNTSLLAAAIPPTATFDTTASFFSGVNGLTAANATSTAPSVTTLLFSFVAADVGASVYIKTGTNFIAGFYRIVSVAGGAATLDRACGTVDAPTGATFGVDYSGLPTPRYTATDLVIGSTTTQFSSASLNVGGTLSTLIGNSMNVTSGLGFTVQQVIIRSQSGATMTCDRSLGTAGSTAGSCTVGGATVSSVAQGATTLPTISWPYETSGWLSVGSQMVRYSGVNGNSLIGIPATGPGALTASVPYGTVITALPALTGVNANNGLARAMAKGAAIHIWVQRDDRAAQAALGALELDKEGQPTDGIREDLIVDERRGEPSLIEVCDAALGKFSRPIVSVAFQKRDPKLKSGTSVYVDQPTLGPVGYYLIQDVTITFDGPALMPRFSVKASSSAFTLMDLFRKAVIVP